MLWPEHERVGALCKEMRPCQLSHAILAPKCMGKSFFQLMCPFQHSLTFSLMFPQVAHLAGAARAACPCEERDAVVVAGVDFAWAAIKATSRKPRGEGGDWVKHKPGKDVDT